MKAKYTKLLNYYGLFIYILFVVLSFFFKDEETFISSQLEIVTLIIPTVLVMTSLKSKSLNHISKNRISLWVINNYSTFISLLLVFFSFVGFASYFTSGIQALLSTFLICSGLYLANTMISRKNITKYFYIGATYLYVFYSLNFVSDLDQLKSYKFAYYILMQLLTIF